MLILKFQETFKTRFVEWCAAGSMAMFGFLMIGNDEVFSRPFYQTLRQIFSSPDNLGILCLVAGAARLTVLFINGAWRRTPLFRMIGCATGMLLQAMFMVSTLTLEWVTPTIAFYFQLFLLDCIALKYATDDNILVSKSVGSVGAHGSG